MEYADLIKQYAVLESISHSWDGEGEYVILLPIGKAHRISRMVKRLTRAGVRTRILKHRRIRWRILWK